MVKKILVIILCVTAFCVILVILLPTEKKRFKRDIMSFKKAVEQENTREAIGFIAPDYRDRKGMTYPTFADMIERFATEFDSMNASMSGLKVFIDSTDEQGVLFAHCSLGLKLFARYQGDRTLLYGGIVRPASVRAWFRKMSDQYQVYDATY